MSNCVGLKIGGYMVRKRHDGMYTCAIQIISASIISASSSDHAAPMEDNVVKTKHAMTCLVVCFCFVMNYVIGNNNKMNNNNNRQQQPATTANNDNATS